MRIGLINRFLQGFKNRPENWFFDFPRARLLWFLKLKFQLYHLLDLTVAWAKCLKTTVLSVIGPNHGWPSSSDLKHSFNCVEAAQFFFLTANFYHALKKWNLFFHLQSWPSFIFPKKSRDIFPEFSGLFFINSRLKLDKIIRIDFFIQLKLGRYFL